MGNVLVLVHLHRCDWQEATNQWKTKTLVNKPKQELQRDLWTNVSSNITNTTAYEKLTSDNGKQRIPKTALRELSTYYKYKLNHKMKTGKHLYGH